MKKLFEYLIEHGGSIVSSNDLSPDWINQARASDRMWVDDFGYGFIWEPPITGFPTNDKELELFERWYPLPVELPEDLKNSDKLFEEIKRRKQAREN